MAGSRVPSRIRGSASANAVVGGTDRFVKVWHMAKLTAPLPVRTRRGPIRPTIRQVAADAGVSIATVSGVLAQRPDCRASEATRARVLAAVERLGYRPSRMAHALHGIST